MVPDGGNLYASVLGISLETTRWIQACSLLKLPSFWMFLHVNDSCQCRMSVVYILDESVHHTAFALQNPWGHFHSSLAMLGSPLCWGQRRGLHSTHLWDGILLTTKSVVCRKDASTLHIASACPHPLRHCHWGQGFSGVHWCRVHCTNADNTLQSGDRSTMPDPLTDSQAVLILHTAISVPSLQFCY